MAITMKANRIHVFGSPEVILFEDVPRPTPSTGEVLVRVHAAGVGPWDASVRAGHSALPQPLPLTLGADLAGIVEATVSSDSPFSVGDEVFGVTNPRFYGRVRAVRRGIHSHAGAQAAASRLLRVRRGTRDRSDGQTDALSSRPSSTRGARVGSRWRRKCGRLRGAIRTCGRSARHRLGSSWAEGRGGAAWSRRGDLTSQ